MPYHNISNGTSLITSRDMLFAGLFNLLQEETNITICPQRDVYGTWDVYEHSGDVAYQNVSVDITPNFHQRETEGSLLFKLKLSIKSWE